MLFRSIYHVWVTVGDGKVTDISRPFKETNWVDGVDEGDDPEWDAMMSEKTVEAAWKKFQQAISEGNIHCKVPVTNIYGFMKDFFTFV